MHVLAANRKYTAEEKHQLLANLELEARHKTIQFEAWLKDHLHNFKLHQDGQVLRIPKQVRSMTMREFGEKYNGNVQAALRGYQKERLIAAGADATLGEIDKNTRKRKWVASQEVEDDPVGLPKEQERRASKNARMMGALPSQNPRPGSSSGPGSIQRQRLINRTPSATRTLSRIAASPSPQKHRQPLFTSANPSSIRPPSRPTSPIKHSNAINKQTQNRIPSNSIFNPTLPPKTPAYPGKGRPPQKGENMLSVNGSPIANPFDLGLKWFKSVAADGSDHGTGDHGDLELPSLGEPKKRQGSIIIRRDPSVAFGGISRTISNGNLFTSSQDLTALSSQPTSQLYPQLQPRFPSTLKSQPTPQFQSQTTNGYPPEPMTPKSTRSFSAFITIPTKDGHLLEFDPLQTSPSALDALEGITDSAKKQAKLDMSRLVQAVDKWTFT